MTLVRQIDRMEEAGWIERRADPTDRRARRLFLTEKARPVLGRIWSVANETRDEALARLTPTEGEQLIDLLRRVHDTLSERVPIDRNGSAPLSAAPLPREPAVTAAAAASREPDPAASAAPVPAVEVG